MKRQKEFQRTYYPPDGGLKEPVRDFRDAFSGWDMIRQHFANKTDLASK
jgi:hypothetical protein